MKKGTVFQSLIKSELVINTSILISGSALAQLIPILLRPFLTRPFSAEIFGAYSVYGSLIGILVIISSFKYELAIMSPTKDKEAANVFFLAIFLNLIFNIFLLLVIIIWKTDILHFLNLADAFTGYLFFVPLGTFLLSSYQSINYWLIRKKRFSPISYNKFIRRSFEGMSQLGFKLAKLPHFLIYGDIIGHIANVISGIYQGGKSGLTLNLLSFTKIKYVFSKYNDYPKFNLVPGVMSACSSLLPAIFINKFFSLENAGFMDLSKMLLTIPIALISLSISSVLLQRTSEKFKNKESISKELLLILSIISFIGILEILAISVFGEELFKFIFGAQWGFSGVISKYLVWSFTLNFIVNSFYSLFISLNRIKLLSFWQLFYFISILSLVIFKNNSFLEFVKIYVYIDVFCALIIAVFMTIIVMNYESGLKKLKPIA
jgi:O-antigen/teichoic acid export membrane protein